MLGQLLICAVAVVLVAILALEGLADGRILDGYLTALFGLAVGLTKN